MYIYVYIYAGILSLSPPPLLAPSVRPMKGCVTLGKHRQCWTLYEGVWGYGVGLGVGLGM